MKNTALKNPPVVSREKWLAARRELLRDEKEYTRTRDRLAARRRELPWVKIDQPYQFESPTGRQSLADLFEGRSQLAIYHFMLGPGWEQGCKSCSYIADHLEPMVIHLRARDVTLMLVSHAPLSDITPFKERMGWEIPWVSSHGSGFNQDYHVSFTAGEIERGNVEYNYGRMDFPQTEAPGLSVFAKDAKGQVYHTYSTFGRGVEQFMGTYIVLDLVPKGRDEDPEAPMSWVRHHDRYDQAANVLAAR